MISKRKTKRKDMANKKEKEVVRPSKMPRVALCAYSFKNCLGWEEDPTEHSERGDKMHYAMVHGVKKALADGYVIKEKDQEIVNKLRSIFVEGQTDDGETLYQELKIEVNNNGRKITEGTLDYLLLNKDKTKGLLIDWKFGSTKVKNGPTNMQLQAYTEGAFQKIETLEELNVTIIQPAVMTDEEIENPEGFKITRKESEENFLPNITAIEEAARSATIEDAVPCIENCKYCNRMNCAAWREMIEDAIGFILTGEKSTELRIKWTDSMRNPKEYMVEYTDNMLDMLSEFEDAIKERKKMVTEYAISIGGTERYKVVKSTRETTDWEGLAKRLGATPEEIMRATTRKESAPYLRRKGTKKGQ